MVTIIIQCNSVISSVSAVSLSHCSRYDPGTDEQRRERASNRELRATRPGTVKRKMVRTTGASGSFSGAAPSMNDHLRNPGVSALEEQRDVQ